MEIKSRAAIAFAALTLFAIGLSAAPRQSSGDTPSKSVAVTIDNFTFAPVTLQIAAGTKVVWTNKDDVPHTVVSEDGKTFKSKALDTDDEFSFTFNQPGTYKYFCSVHPKMTGEIIVK